jgi:hypothetical protein
MTGKRGSSSRRTISSDDVRHCDWRTRQLLSRIGRFTEAHDVRRQSVMAEQFPLSERVPG